MTRAHGQPPARATSGVVTAEIDDDDLLGQADWVVGGDAVRQGRRQAWYAGYVALLSASAYGFPLAQAVLRTTDPQWLRAQLGSPVALGTLTAGVVGVLWGLYRAGGYRGPVVPPLPWIDHVVATPIDRARSVRRWWRLSLGGSVFAGALAGATLGAGFAFAGVGSWYAAGLATVATAGVGRVGAALWLWGQVRSWPGPGHGVRVLVSTPSALRALHVDALRTHAANTSTVSGSVLAGNLRTARLQLARPVRHARQARLRAGRPIPVLVRRDLLGLRRVPGSWWAGLFFTALGSTVLGWALTQPAAPALSVTVGLLLAYLGYGSWAEGLRLQADNVGTPSLLGTSPREEVAAHLVVPTTLTSVTLAVALLVAALTGSVPPASVGPAVGTATTLVALLAGGHLLAAFRGSPPALSLRPGSGPMMLVAWYARAGLVVLVVGTVAAALVRSSPTSLPWAAALSAAVVAWGLSQVDRLASEHRV